MPSPIEEFLTEWHGRHPQSFVDALCTPARRHFAIEMARHDHFEDRHSGEDGPPQSSDRDPATRPERRTAAVDANSQKFLQDLVRRADHIREVFEIPDEFFSKKAHCYLVAALADSFSNSYFNIRRDKPLLLFRTAAALVIGRNGTTEQWLRDEIAALTEDVLDDPYEPVEADHIEDAIAEAPTMSNLGSIRALQNQLALITAPDPFITRRSELLSASNRALNDAVAAKMAASSPNSPLSSLRELRSELPECDWIVVSESRFKGAPVPVIGVGEPSGGKGFVVCGDRTAKKLIAERKLEGLGDVVKAAYVAATGCALLGLNGLLNGVAESVRVDSVVALPAELIWTRSPEAFTFEVAETVTGHDFSQPLSQPEHILSTQPVDQFIEHAVVAMGLKGMLNLVILDPYGRTRELVCSPLMDIANADDRYSALVNSLTKRTIQVKGWGALMASTSGHVDEMVRNCGDELGDFSPENLSSVLQGEFGTFDCYVDPLKSILAKPKLELGNTADVGEKETLF